MVGSKMVQTAWGASNYYVVMWVSGGGGEVVVLLCSIQNEKMCIEVLPRGRGIGGRGLKIGLPLLRT